MTLCDFALSNCYSTFKTYRDGQAHPSTQRTLSNCYSTSRSGCYRPRSREYRGSPTLHLCVTRRLHISRVIRYGMYETLYTPMVAGMKLTMTAWGCLRSLELAPQLTLEVCCHHSNPPTPSGHLFLATPPLTPPHQAPWPAAERECFRSTPLTWDAYTFEHVDAQYSMTHARPFLRYA